MLSQYFQLDRLVVEGQASGRQTGKKGDRARLKDTGYVASKGILPSISLFCLLIVPVVGLIRWAAYWDRLFYVTHRGADKYTS